MSSSFLSKFGTDDPRLGNLITPLSNLNNCDVALLGFPYDEGVRRNGGRVGAAKGPSTFRSLMKKIGTLINHEHGVDLTTLQVGDADDIESGLPLVTAHDTLRQRVAELVTNGIIPFVIGGGNDQSFPNGKGLLEGLSKRNGVSPNGITVINIDAHLDVRPLTSEGLAHSGSPFRQLCDDAKFKAAKGNLIEFAAQGHQCSAEHVNYVWDQPKGQILWLSHLRSHPRSISEQFAELLKNSANIIFVSFDIDSISSADCPGVSAPGAVGLTAEEAIQICFEAGKCQKVKLVDASEFNPDVESYRTGRLLCLMFYFFLMGYSLRPKKTLG